MIRGTVWMVVLSMLGIGGVWSVQAATFNSSNYSINGNLGDSSAGGQSSTSYKLTSAAGESIAGSSSSASYKLGQGYISTLENSIQVNLQSNGLSIQYPFDEGTGTAVLDASSNANNAVATGTPTWTTGKVSGGLTLNGTTQYVTGPDVDIPTNITVEMWVNPSTSAQNAKLVSKQSTGSDTQALLQLIAGAPVFGVTNSGAGSLTNATGSSIPNGSWTHLVGTYDGSNVRLYVNGALAATTPATGTIATNNFGWTIGKDANASSGYFNGSVDEFKVLTLALSAEEAKAEYDAQNAGNATGVSFNGGITTGTSKLSSFDAIVQADSPGYTLAINQNNNLTNGGNTIPAVSGSIGSPVTWSEGTTKGLGFTLYGTTATAIPGSWSSGNAYAALPGSGTTFYTRTGYTGGAKDTLNMRLRLDVTGSQAAGLYTNQMTVTGTMVP